MPSSIGSHNHRMAAASSHVDFEAPRLPVSNKNGSARYNAIPTSDSRRAVAVPAAYAAYSPQRARMMAKIRGGAVVSSFCMRSMHLPLPRTSIPAKAAAPQSEMTAAFEIELPLPSKYANPAAPPRAAMIRAPFAGSINVRRSSMSRHIDSFEGCLQWLQALDASKEHSL